VRNELGASIETVSRNERGLSPNHAGCHALPSRIAYHKVVMAVTSKVTSATEPLRLGKRRSAWNSDYSSPCFPKAAEALNVL